MKDLCVKRVEVSLHGATVHLVSKLLALIFGLRQLLLHQLEVRPQLRDLCRVNVGRPFEANFTSARFCRRELLFQIFHGGLVIINHLGQDGNPVLVELTTGDGQLVLVRIQETLVAITFLSKILKCLSTEITQQVASKAAFQKFPLLSMFELAKSIRTCHKQRVHLQSKCD